MTTKTKYPLRSSQHDAFEIAGSFAPAGTGAPTAVYGEGFSVVRTSAGLFTVTLDDAFPQLSCVTATLQMAAAGDQVLSIGDTSAGSSSANATIQLIHWDISGAAVADITADANARIHFRVTVKMTGV